MAKKIYLKNNAENKICKDFSSCNHLKVDWIKDKFCYQGGGCPEQYVPIIKELIKENFR